MFINNQSTRQTRFAGEVRQNWLDWLRAIAILLVLGSHYQIDWWDAGIFRPWAQFNMRFGWSGVDMFFVISGFLIGGLLLVEIDEFQYIDLSRFYIRRATKIWPLLYLVPLAYIFLEHLLIEKRDRFGFLAFVPTFLHVQNYFTLPMGHLWSLAVEEHFYLVLPIILTCAISRRTSKTSPYFLPFLFLLIILFIVIIRIVSVYYLNVATGSIRIQTQYRLDGLLIGVLLAWVYNYSFPFWKKVENSQITVFVFATCLWPFLFNPNKSLILAAFGLTFISIFYACGVILTSRYKGYLIRNHRLGGILNTLAWIGRRSYPIYLFHPFIWLCMVKLGIIEMSKSPSIASKSIIWISGYLVFISLSILVGAIISHLAERPLLILRNMILPAKNSALRPKE